MQGNIKHDRSESSRTVSINFARILGLLLAVVMLLTSVPLGIFAEGEDGTAPTSNEDGTASGKSGDDGELRHYDSNTFSDSSYSVYRDAHSTDKLYLGEDIVINSSNISSDTNMNVEVISYDGVEKAIWLKDQTEEQESSVRDDLVENMELTETEFAYITFDFSVPETALYEIKVNYYPIVYSPSGEKISAGATIERGFMIDDAYPFDEMKSVTFSRFWSDVSEIGSEHDGAGNEIKSNSVETPRWNTEYLNGDETYYYDSFKVYVEAGSHTLKIYSLRSDVLIESIVLCAGTTLKTYSEVQAEYSANGYKPVSDNATLKIQAEQTAFKSESSVYPYHDRSSALTTANSGDFSYDHTQINVIGGEMWERAGQWLTWTVTPNETGLYLITLRGRQNVNRSLSSGRALLINGEYPFEEAKQCSFFYNADFGYYTLGQEKINTEGTDGAFWFYFEAGKTYELSLEATLGAIETLARTLDDIVNELMTVYRRMLALCGPNPDEDNDYQFQRYLPNEYAKLDECSKTLRSIAADLFELTGEKSANSAILERTADRLDKMYARPLVINKNFTGFKNDITSIAEWILDLQTQPLELDCIFISGSKECLPRAEAGFFRSLGHEIKLLWSSFIVDYSSIGSESESEKTITVWFTPTAAASVTGGGREQAQILKRLIESEFYEQYPGIGVNLQIIAIGALLPATLAGKGPDVVLGVNYADPVNYAMRGAVVDLAQFDDCDEILQRFYPSTYTCFKYLDGVYALPEVMTYHVMFYRTDIFEEYGWKVPESWEDIYDLIPDLSNYFMDFGCSQNTYNFYCMLFQNRDDLYQGEGDDYGYRTNLDSDANVDAFIRYVNLYRSYGVNLSIDFLTRFRTGEVPIGIDNITMVNKFAISAPEISGCWSFTLIPGVEYVNEDGSTEIDHSIATTGTGTIIMSKSEYPEESWNFLKWWSSDDTQIEYSAEVEATMGEAARVFSANKSVIYTQGWSTEELNKILVARSWTRGIPQVPGGYYTERHMTNAFVRTYTLRTDPRETLLDYIDEINLELSKKREEFGLRTLEEIQGGSN